MRSFKSRLLAQLLCGIAATVLFASTATAAKPSVPFQAIIAITEQVGPDPTGTCPISPALGYALAGDIRGTGNASQLGKVELRSFDCIQVAGPGVFFFFSTNLVLTAANGDQVFARYYGTLDARNPASAALTGRFEIVGGSGRFANATGGGTLSGVENINPQTLAGEGQVELTGTISY
jgi:hypothetical protein